MPEETTLPEPRNVREAIEQRQAAGDPGFVEVTEDEAHAYADGTPSGDAEDFSDVFGEEQTPSAEGAPTEPVATPPSATDPYETFGGRQSVEDAVVLANALKTETGVRTIVAQGLQALGYTPDAVSEFLRNQAAGVPQPSPTAAPAPPAASDPFAGLADLSDDDVVTGGDVKKLLGAVVEQITSSVGQQISAAQQAAVQPLQQQVMEDRQRNAQQAVDTTLTELLGIADGTPTELQQSQIGDVQAFAARYLDGNSWDPQHIANAIRRGHADMVARDDARFQAYVAQKRAAKAAQPANIGGASPAGGEEAKEPRTVKEAIAMRKAMGL